MNDPAISIVMPMFNSENYLYNSIRSILSQSFQDFELLIIDDGSEDNCVGLVSEIKDSRIKLHQNKHDFIGSLNMGLDLSKGRYIARTDSDDIMHPDKLKIQYQFMEENPEVDVCGTWAKCFGIKDNEITAPQSHNEIASALLFGNMLIHPSVMMRRESIDKNNLRYKHEYIYAEDYKLWVDCVMSGLKLANIPEILLNYFCGENQVTNRHYDKMMNVTGRIRIKYAEYVINLLAGIDDDSYIFMEKLNTLLDNDRISTKSFFYILSSFYKDYLNKHE